MHSRKLPSLFGYLLLIVRYRWFSSIFAASKNFPDFTGIAAGTSTAFFSLSPMFISILASRFFTHLDEGLDVTRFLQFLAFTCGAVHLFGGFTLHIIPPPEDHPSVILEDSEGSAHVDERTTLLQGKRNHTAEIEVDVISVSTIDDSSVIALLKDHNFWALAFIMFVILGSVSLFYLYHWMVLIFEVGKSETVMSNIGTMVLSLPSYSPSTIAAPSTDAATATQVRLISAANTLSRLLVGLLADFVSPITSHLPSGAQIIQRKYHISRIALLFIPILVLALTYLWMVVGVRSQVDLWALRSVTPYLNSIITPLDH